MIAWAVAHDLKLRKPCKCLDHGHGVLFFSSSKPADKQHVAERKKSPAFPVREPIRHVKWQQHLTAMKSEPVIHIYILCVYIYICMYSIYIYTYIIDSAILSFGDACDLKGTVDSI